MKQQVRNKLHGKAGFTLVELIVVIAILGILAGIGTVGYSGYVERANKGADQQLIGNIKYALELAYAADPTYSGVDSIVLHKGADADISADSWTQDAMTKAFGTDPEKQMHLKYGKWGKGAAVLNQTLNHFKNETDPDLRSVFTGAIQPSFAGDVDDLFNVIRDTSILVSGKMDAGSGAALIQGAAGKTIVAYPTSGEFANAWATSTWANSLMGEENYTKNDIDHAQENANTGFLENAIANAGAIKARNTALACYLRKEGYGEMYDYIADYNYDGSGIPRDIGAIVLGGTNDEGSEEHQKSLEFDAMAEGKIDEAVLGDFYDAISTYYGKPTEANPSGLNLVDTQAYKDGLAYYAMMNTVKNVNTENTDDAAYWDEMAGAVSLYGSIAQNGTTDLNDLSSTLSGSGENDVVVTVMAANGKMTVSVSPTAAMPG